jgi:hypothetical protein
VLAKVGGALKDVDKQIWVQGHTDDQPIYVPKKPDPKVAAAPAKVDPKKKADPKAKATTTPTPPPKKPGDASDAVLAFVTNWELSAARAHRRPLPAGRREARSDAAGRRRVRSVPPGQQEQGEEPAHRDRAVPACRDHAEVMESSG